MNINLNTFHLGNTVKPFHTGMPWGQTFILVWTGSGLERVFLLSERNKQR